MGQGIITQCITEWKKGLRQDPGEYNQDPFVCDQGHEKTGRMIVRCTWDFRVTNHTEKWREDTRQRDFNVLKWAHICILQLIHKGIYQSAIKDDKIWEVKSRTLKFSVVFRLHKYRSILLGCICLRKEVNARNKTKLNCLSRQRK